MVFRAPLQFTHLHCTADLTVPAKLKQGVPTALERLQYTQGQATSTMHVMCSQCCSPLPAASSGSGCSLLSCSQAKDTEVVVI